MPLDDLVSVIETLKERVQTHRQDLQANETRTRMALIDPLLQALGWDTTDPALVLPEYEVSGSRADYALLDGTDKPVALVEAKRLGESLASHREQIVRYANLSGVPYAGLTDGDHWELYKVFDPVPIEDRLRLNISIADLPAHEVALKLLLLWQPNLASGQPIEANEPILATVTEPATPQPVAEPEVERPPAPTLEQAPEPPPAAGWVPLSELASTTGQSPPTAIRFLDGSTCEVESWQQMLQPTIRWLWSNRRLTMSNIPVTSSTGTHLVNTTGSRPSGQPFRNSRPIAETPLFLDGNLTSGHMAVDFAKRLLQECGVNVEDVQLRFGED